VVPAQPANVPVKPLGQPGPEGFPDEVLQKLVVDGYGNRYMAGYSFNGTDYDIRVLKYTAGGSLLWDQEFDFGSQEFGFSLAVDPVDQHVYVGGYGVQFSLYEAILLKLDLAGVLEWKVVNGTDSEVKTYYDLAADSAGVYAAGERYNGSNFDAMVAFHQPDGALVWESVRNSNDTESAYSIELSACEGCPALVAGSHGGDFAEGWVDVIDLSTGALSNFSGDTGFAVQDLAPGEDSVLVGGSRAGDYVIASLTGGGDETWRTTVPEGRQLRAVVADRSGFIYAVGNTEGPGERDAFVVLMDQEGNVLSTQPLDQGGSEALHAAVIGPEGLLTTAGQSSGGDNNNNFLLILYDTGKSLLNIAQ